MKIRGFRIETSEVESRLLESAAVQLVFVHGLQEGTQERLAAYCVADTGHFNARMIRSKLRDVLPPIGFLTISFASSLALDGQLQSRHENKVTDTGRTLAQGFPEITADDTEASLSAKNSHVADKLATQFLRKAANRPISGKTQTGLANTFFFRDRKLACD